MTSAEFTEWKAYFKKLEKYYDKVNEDEDLRKLCEHAKCKNRIPKNYMPTDDKDEEIMEVGSVAKDTETDEDDESSSGSSGGEYSEKKTEASKTEQGNAVKDIMPTTDDDSEAGIENESEELDEEQHVSSAGMVFKCSQCAKIWKMKSALNCKKCSQCAKKVQEEEQQNIMPENKENTTSPSSEELDLENVMEKRKSKTRMETITVKRRLMKTRLQKIKQKIMLVRKMLTK